MLCHTPRSLDSSLGKTFLLQLLELPSCGHGMVEAFCPPPVAPTVTMNMQANCDVGSVRAFVLYVSGGGGGDPPMHLLLHAPLTPPLPQGQDHKASDFLLQCGVVRHA